MAVNPFIFLSDNPSRNEPAGSIKMTEEELDSDVVVNSPCLVLDGSDERSANNMLRAIRQHQLNGIYLKPVLLEQLPDGTADTLLIAAVDGVVPINADIGIKLDGELEVLIHGINARSSAIQQNKQILSDQQTPFRLLRYISTRQLEIQPVMTSARISGFSYPSLEAFFSIDDNSVWSALSLLETQHMVKAEFVTRKFQCSHCHSAFLNFIETCPDCYAVNIDCDDLIHHFRCGHSAASREFKRAGEMECPKCSQQLKQIGVDHDKPSLTYRCKECQLVFEEPKVSTVCYHCNRKTDTEHQTQSNVYAYSITALGENAALFGTQQLLNNALGEHLTLFEYEPFQRFLGTEIARIERYKLSTSTVLIVNIGGFVDAMAALGQRSTELYKELAEIFSDVLRTSDVITTRGQSIFIMLLVETSYSASSIALERLTDRIERLFQDSLSISAELTSEKVEVNKNLELKALIETFLS